VDDDAGLARRAGEGARQVAGAARQVEHLVARRTFATATV
jgi:hypothetical protein